MSEVAATVLRRRLDRRAAPSVEARRRLQRLDRALGPPLRDAELDRPAPRRARPRPRARSRDPSVPGARAGRLPPEHAADRRRDGFGLRRGARLRPAARETTDPGARLGLLAESIEGQIATVFRQIAMNRSSTRSTRPGASEGELSVERFGELWTETQSEMLGDSVEVTDDYSRLVVATSRTSSARPATSTPTPTASCWRSRSTGSMSSAVTRSSPATSRC